MDPLGQTRFGVLTLGGVAASLILWLSISFWLDAWDQRQGARQFRQAAQVDAELLAVTRQTAIERHEAITQLAQPYAIDEHGTARRDTTRLAAMLGTVEAALADPLLASGFRFSTTALEAIVEALRHTRGVVDSQHAANARLLAATAGRTATDVAADVGADAARERAMRRTYARTTHLIERLHELYDGLHLEARIPVRAISDLRLLRTDLRDFAEHASRASTLLALTRAGLPERRGNAQQDWSMLASAQKLSVRTAVQRLRHHQNDALLSASLFEQLGNIIEMTRFGDPGRDSVMQAVGGIEAQIARRIEQQIDKVEAHAHRRLVVDSLLILVCVWIGVTSIRLLRIIQHHAWHDRVTGLVNRHRFEHLLESARSDAQGRNEPLAVFVLGIDNFTGINSRVGHAIGDVLLKLLAERVSLSADDEQPVGALGGDHFAVIVRRADSLDDLLHRAETLRQACAWPYEAEGATLQITLSLGVASCDPSTGADPDGMAARELLLQAEVAMRQAKDDGRDRIRLFDQALAERNRENLELERALRHAITDDQLELHYQPKVCLRTGQIDAAEALVRWQHPDRGAISPGVFVPIAERTGLILPIGTWVLNEAIRQAACWHRERSRPIQVAVNISAQQFLAGTLADDIERLLGHHRLPPRYLELEITESVGMIDMALVVDQLSRLRASGISIAIDDFGTDYSSLQYLDILPLDKLKIDRAFILQLGGGKGRSLARTIVRLAESLQLETVAEGVETDAQLSAVRAMGCDYVQGYYYSRPLPAGPLPAAIADIESLSVPALRPAA